MYCLKRKQCSIENPKMFNTYMDDDLCYCADCFEFDDVATLKAKAFDKIVEAYHTKQLSSSGMAAVAAYMEEVKAVIEIYLTKT